MAMEELESLLAEWSADQERDARKADQAKLMWHVISAIYNAVRDDDVVKIVAGSETDKVLCEIVNYVEGWE